MERPDPQEALRRILGPAEPEVGCDACFDQLDRYVDLGPDPPRAAEVLDRRAVLPAGKLDPSTGECRGGDQRGRGVRLGDRLQLSRRGLGPV